MAGLAAHIVRRGIESASQLQDAKDRLQKYEVSTTAIVCLGVTFLLMCLALFSIRYSLGEVMATLASVESPTATVAVDVETSDDPDAPLLGTDEKRPQIPELFVVKNKPITSSIRKTGCHLYAKAGPFSPWRGLSLYIIMQLAHCYLANLFAMIYRSFVYPISIPLGAITASVLLSAMSMGWTHVVISEPSTKTWAKRLPDRKAWKKIIPATAIYAFAEQVTLGLPIAAFFLTDLPHTDPREFFNGDDILRKKLVIQALTVMVVGLGTAILILIPAGVTLTRVQASMLPEEDETIVPFDRSFGGKVVPEIVGGSGKVGLLDAWRTFGWASRMRLLGVYIKTGMREFSCIVCFMVLFAAQIFYFMGDAVDDFVLVLRDVIKTGNL